VIDLNLTRISRLLRLKAQPAANIDWIPRANPTVDLFRDLVLPDALETKFRSVAITADGVVDIHPVDVLPSGSVNVPVERIYHVGVNANIAAATQTLRMQLGIIYPNSPFIPFNTDTFVQDTTNVNGGVGVVFVDGLVLPAGSVLAVAVEALTVGAPGNVSVRAVTTLTRSN